MERLKELETIKISSVDGIPFVDNKISMFEEDYLVKTHSVLIRKKNAGFITDEEYSRLNKDMLDNYTKYRFGS